MTSGGSLMNKNRLLRTLRYVAWWAVLAALAGFLLLAAQEMQKHSPARAAQTQGLPLPGFAAAPFTLTTVEGKVFTRDGLAGKPFMMFFGFTHCPMICPTVLADMVRWLEKLGEGEKKINALFISVDPERDTVAVMKDYMQPFAGKVTGLTGTPAQLAQMAKDYAFTYKKIPLSATDYSMDHTAAIYLFDASAHFVGTIDANEDDDVALGKLRLLLERK